MFAYAIRRLASACIVVLCVLVFLALLVRFIPGDPLTSAGDLAMGEDASLTERIREEMGVNDPVLIQIWEYARGVIVHGDIGTNVITKRPVSEEIARVLPHTLALAASTVIFSLTIGSLLGILAAAKSGGVTDRLLSMVAIGAWTTPSYLGALLLLLICVVWLDILPAVGAGQFSDITDYSIHLIMPTIALSLPWIGIIARNLRSYLLDIVNELYMTSARAFGISESKIFLKYGLRNALIPTIALVALGVGHLLAGAVYVEIIFARPGLGSMLINSIIRRNFPVTRGAVFVIVIIFVSVNLLADLFYRVIDPRVRVDKQ